jgi:acyl-CoA synthetase (AMP-forming)/AMP-acid ligase II
VLRSHPAVNDVAVAGIPDSEMGHLVGAAVVAAGPVDANELKVFARGRLANFKTPEVVAFVDAIPYNDFGKVSRRVLAELITERAYISGRASRGSCEAGGADHGPRH